MTKHFVKHKMVVMLANFTFIVASRFHEKNAITAITFLLLIRFYHFFFRPIGLPVLRKVRVHNLNAQSSIQMLSISGNTIHFHCSFFTDKVNIYILFTLFSKKKDFSLSLPMSTIDIRCSALLTHFSP